MANKKKSEKDSKKSKTVKPVRITDPELLQPGIGKLKKGRLKQGVHEIKAHTFDTKTGERI